MGYNVKKEKEDASVKRDQFRTFEDLEVYQVAREFRKEMYAVNAAVAEFRKV